MDKVKDFVKRLTEHFDGIPKVKLVADKIGVPTGYIAIGILFVAMFLVFSDIGSHAICDVIGIVYPAYMSFKAIESKETDDDKQWLTYWVVFALVQVGETFFDFFLFWIPFYFLFKLMFLIFLAFPETRGAYMLYERVLKPVLKLHEEEIDSAIAGARSRATEMKAEATKAATGVAKEHAGDVMAAGAGLMADKKAE
jgi:receptor expression-enhancing protein 5/6